MIPHYRFPDSTKLNRRLPKEAFYQRLSPASTLRQAFVVQVQEIVWRNKLAADTLNIAPGGDYPELQVLDIELKEGVAGPDVAVLRAIDSLIVFPVYYRLTRRSGDTRLLQYQLAYKAPVVEGENKVNPARYFASPWLPLPGEDDLSPLPVVLDISQLYRQLLQPLSTLRPRRDEPLTAWMARLDDVARQEKRISQLQHQLQREKQFNHRVELNRALVELTDALKALQSVHD
ncbi:DUF4391 domain-containing protein [Lonsdalea quercina]|uniref:DUF4391 domain-containing protein n=1 Tax=Lonsdalea quercina TaxID=71657 RepID=UPI003976668B